MHRRRISPLSLGLVLALGVSLTTVAQTSAPGAEPQAMSPAQSSPTRDSQQPDQPQGQTQSQGNSVDDQLQLTQDQKEKIAAIVDGENRQLAALRNDNSLTLEQKQQKAAQIRQAGVPKIKAMLTPEQLQKLDLIVQERDRQQQSNPQGSPQAPPQR